MQEKSMPALRLDAQRLLDTLLRDLGLRHDSALARSLGLRPCAISRLRHGKGPVTSDMLLKMHDATGKSIRELRNMMGDTRCGYWPIRNDPAQSQQPSQ